MAMTPAWVPLMAAMMLPAAVPAVVRSTGERLAARAVPLFVAAYAVVWLVVAAALYALYRPPGEAAAAALVIVAGLYELTPLKRACRRRCQERTGNGLRFGVHCVGSSIGLMVLLLAVDAMSMTWMLGVAALVVAQKLVPPARPIDVPLGLCIAALGVAMLV